MPDVCQTGKLQCSTGKASGISSSAKLIGAYRVASSAVRCTANTVGFVFVVHGYRCDFRRTRLARRGWCQLACPWGYFFNCSTECVLVVQ